MNLYFYIARRYLFAKKTHNIINIISAISVGGVTIGTAALIIVLSVFNGFEGLVVGMFNSFNPDLKVSPLKGKTFQEKEIDFKKIYQVSNVSHITKVIEENALIKYHEKQYIASIKAVSEDFHQTSRIDSMIVSGDAALEYAGKYYALVGQGIAYYLGLSLNDYDNPLSIYVPRHLEGNQIDPLEAFNSQFIQPSGIFSIQQEYDQKYVIVPLRFARTLLEYDNELSALEIKIKNINYLKNTVKELESIFGNNFTVKDRYQQEELLFKIMKSEKLIVFLILSFILLIATFNVIGSLSMLILDKKKDISVLKSMGASKQTIRNIFFTEGMMITLFGGLLGMLLGGMVCWLQLQFGFIKMNTGATFIIEAYPVKILFQDFLYVLLIVLVIGFFAAWYPVKYISKKHLEARLA
ncbi:MAG: FtsX-like permease family protein [Bacteroidales bacterium]|nr:FtsX-like permease family protein [Bacteroidales bacterium]